MGFRPGVRAPPTITTSTKGQGDDFRQGQSQAQGQAQRRECEACGIGVKDIIVIFYFFFIFYFLIFFYFILFSDDIIFRLSAAHRVGHKLVLIDQAAAVQRFMFDLYFRVEDALELQESNVIRRMS